MTNRTTKELLKDAEDLQPRLKGVYTIPVNDGAGLLNGKREFTRKFDVPPINLEAAALIAELSTALKEGEWRKGEPDIDATVLMQHELGAGGNYDVACYRGRDKQGNDIYMMSNGTEIFKHHVITWKPITPPEEDDAN